MSVVSAIRDMIAKGFTVEQALLAAEVMEASLSGPKSNAQRQAEWRERQKAKRNENNESNENNENVTFVTASREIENAPTHAEPEPNITTYPTTSEANASSVKPPKAAKSAKPRSDRPGCISALTETVRSDLAEAIVEHREKIRKPMTVMAARLLARSLGAAPDPNAAAEMMIERGWQGYRPDWGRNDRAPPHRQAKRNTALDDLNDRAEGFFANVQHFPRIAG